MHSLPFTETGSMIVFYFWFFLSQISAQILHLILWEVTMQWVECDCFYRTLLPVYFWSQCSASKTEKKFNFSEKRRVTSSALSLNNQVARWRASK